MVIMKRSGAEVPFDTTKIENAIRKANRSVAPEDRLQESNIHEIALDIERQCVAMTSIPTVEGIQDLVIFGIMAAGKYRLALSYTTYRYQHELRRKENTTDAKILAILRRTSQEAREENSNKNVDIVSTQRDYIAGEVSRDITRRMILPEDIMVAHDEGRIHFHDTDYAAQPLHNCDLVNLEDMLQNGTVISGTLIEKPHMFSTACNIATQIIAQVASSQYGGQTISLTHLAPFVDVSRQRFRKLVREEAEAAGVQMTDEQVKTIAEIRTLDDVKRGVQIVQYQVITLMTTNGQAPFISVCMYLNECGDNKALRDDLALVIKEVLEQRIQGVKNESGAWVTPAFPKLLYFMEPDNAYPGTEYYWLTELAAKCSIKRMVPDIISEKIMLQNKVNKNGEGQAYPCMGCVDGNEVITYRFGGHMYVESFRRMWNRLAKEFLVKHQFSPDNPNVYMDVEGVEIYDTVKGFVNTKRVIRNVSDNWVRVKMSNGRLLTCTGDHPFATNRGRVFAKDLVRGDAVKINHGQAAGEDERVSMSPDLAWLYGVMLCDGSIESTPCACFALTGEDDIVSKAAEVFENVFHIPANIKEQHRGAKGDYKEILFPSRDFQYELISKFEGIAKDDRHVPNEVFTYPEAARLAFLAGMIDADGYMNSIMKLSSVQVGSTNKELALQQMALAQSLGMPAAIYENRYNKGSDKLRYRVEFVPTEAFIRTLTSGKKAEKFKNSERTNHSRMEASEAEVLEVKELQMTGYSYDVTTESDHFEVSGVYSHNCRSFLTPYIDPATGKGKYYGRFNQGVVTINLPYVALDSNGKENIQAFWKNFDETLDMCHRALRIRHEHLRGTVADVAPILWRYGAIARLKSGETIDKLLYGGYSTISLGYAGLYECVVALTGKSHTSPEGKKLAMQIMQHMNDKCAEWKAAENIDYSLYGTPLESTTYKFAKTLQKKWGKIPEVSDHGYITNSYHVNVREPIDAFTKLGFEAEFQKLSPGGAISYVEIPNLDGNLEAALALYQYIYENIMYAELNTKSDYCQVCGYTGEIKIVEEDGKLLWECPNCKNRDQKKMNVARRTCGYIGTQFWNQGRTQEIRDRVLHL